MRKRDPDPDPGLAGDLLWGASAVAKYVLGNGNAKFRRKIYHLHACGQIPLQKIGAEIVGSRKVLREYLQRSTPSKAA